MLKMVKKILFMITGFAFVIVQGAEFKSSYAKKGGSTTSERAFFSNKSFEEYFEEAKKQTPRNILEKTFGNPKTMFVVGAAAGAGAAYHLGQKSPKEMGICAGVAGSVFWLTGFFVQNRYYNRVMMQQMFIQNQNRETNVTLNCVLDMQKNVDDIQKKLATHSKTLVDIHADVSKSLIRAIDIDQRTIKMEEALEAANEKVSTVITQNDTIKGMFAGLATKSDIKNLQGVLVERDVNALAQRKIEVGAQSAQMTKGFLTQLRQVLAQPVIDSKKVSQFLQPVQEKTKIFLQAQAQVVADVSEFSTIQTTSSKTGTPAPSLSQSQSFTPINRTAEQQLDQEIPLRQETSPTNPTNTEEGSDS